MGEIIPGFEASHLERHRRAAGTPAEIVERLNREINAGLSDPALRQRFADVGAVPVRFTPAEASARVASDADKWAKVIERAGIKPE